MIRIKHIFLVLIIFGFFSCSEENKKITQRTDYDRFLVNSEKPSTTSKYFRLWNDKITSDSTELLSFGNVATEYTRYFKNTGDISFLKKAEHALKKAVEIANINKAGYARALARNYISQHRFKEALAMAQLADSIGSGITDTQNLYFDVHMELGNYIHAEKYLDSLKNFSDFGYLIRLAKWNDYKGDLNTTIKMMEKALARAESANNQTLKLWSYTNIADYYGHAGRLKESYQHYLKSLQLDPQNVYAKKGIAWIVFSHEKNGEEALRILNSVTANYQSPDYYLLKAEIAEFIGEDEISKAYMGTYSDLVQNKSYGDMYNAYQVDYYLQYEQLNRALRLAELEVDNRPTPESYSLLANTYLELGKEQEALAIAENYIVDKTFEPGILLKVAKIYEANHQFEKVDELKSELLGAIYELGPSSKEQIEQL